MPIRRKAVDAGILEPSELALLGRVFEQLKVAEQTADEQGRLASRISAYIDSGTLLAMR